jgi:ferric-dicitrate binding protein FerR (iron transport regulator)
MADPSGPTSADRRLAALFPDVSATAARAPWWRRRAGVTVVVGVVVALVLSTVVAMSAFGSSGDDYRTATVATRSVDSVWHGVATIEPVAQ